MRFIEEIDLFIILIYTQQEAQFLVMMYDNDINVEWEELKPSKVA